MTETIDFGIQVPTEFSDSNIWGGIINGATVPQLAKLAGGAEPIELSGTSGSILATAGADNQYRNAAWIFLDDGVSGPYTLTIPSVEKCTLVYNAMGTYGITFDAGGDTAELTPGQWGFLIVNGSGGHCVLLTFSGLTSTEVSDNVFRILGSGDASKKLAFNADTITAGQTRTIDAPNASGTMALLEQDQQWTGAQRSGTGTTLTSATTITPTLLNWEGNRASLTLSHNATIANPSDIASAVGFVGRIVGQQNSEGGYDLDFGNVWFPIGRSDPPSVPTGPNDKFRIDLEVV